MTAGRVVLSSPPEGREKTGIAAGTTRHAVTIVGQRLDSIAA